MTIKQIAVFMENKPGTMSKVTEALGKFRYRRKGGISCGYSGFRYTAYDSD